MARVTVISPAVSASAIRLRVGVAVVAPVVQAAVSFARAETSNITPVVATSSVVLASELSYILLAVGAYLDTSGRYRYTADIALVTDASVLYVGKQLADSAGVGDIASVGAGKVFYDSATAIDSSTIVDGIEYGITKRTNDAVVVPDVYSAALAKPFSESSAVSDTSTYLLGMVKTEVVTASDLLTAVLVWSRSFLETALLFEQQFKTATLANPIEAANRYVLAGYVFDGYVAVDSVFTTDALGGIIQSYVSGDYFAENYVGTTFGPY